MTAHTPTPWRVFTAPDGRKLVGIGGMDGQGVLDAGFGVWSWMDADGVANAELVVRAVNAHERYEAALRAIADDDAVPPFVRTLARATLDFDQVKDALSGTI
jgi:hypothetical protein